MKASGCSCQLGQSHTEWSLSLAARAPCDWSLSAPGTRGHRHIISLYHEHTLSLIRKIHFPISRKDILSKSELSSLLHQTSEVICDILLRSLSTLSLTLWHWFWSLVTKLSLRELEPDWGQLLVNQSPHSPDPTLAICWHPPTGRLWISFVRI